VRVQARGGRWLRATSSKSAAATCLNAIATTSNAPDHIHRRRSMTRTEATSGASEDLGVGGLQPGLPWPSRTPYGHLPAGPSGSFGPRHAAAPVDVVWRVARCGDRVQTGTAADLLLVPAAIVLLEPERARLRAALGFAAGLTVALLVGAAILELTGSLTGFWHWSVASLYGFAAMNWTPESLWFRVRYSLPYFIAAPRDMGGRDRVRISLEGPSGG